MGLKKLEQLTEKLQYKLRDEQLALRALSNLINDGFWDWDVKTNYEYMNPRFWEILGYDHKTKKHVPEEWQKLIHPDDLKVAINNVNEHFSSKGKIPYYNVCRYKNGKTGEWVKLVCRGTVIAWDENDNPLRMVGTHTLLPE